MRDWILEMHRHTAAIQEAVNAAQGDEAWRLIHAFQDWCHERIDAERYPPESAGTLLSVPQQFMVRILAQEGKYRQALCHLVFQAVLDARNLKYYPKAIKSHYKKCGFVNTPVDAAIELYEFQKQQRLAWHIAFLEIRKTVSSWS